MYKPQLTDYKNTSIILNESQFITLFPKATCLKNFSYILKTYCGMSDEEINRAYKLPTRWVTYLQLFQDMFFIKVEFIPHNRTMGENGMNIYGGNFDLFQRIKDLIKILIRLSYLPSYREFLQKHGNY